MNTAEVCDNTNEVYDALMQMEEQAVSDFWVELEEHAVPDFWETLSQLATSSKLDVHKNSPNNNHPSISSRMKVL